jgi:hypothetical protein
MNKKLMVIPMKGQYEQQCNAAALKEMGVPVLKSFKMKHVDKIKKWVKYGEKIEVNFPDMTDEIISKLIKEHSDDVETLQLGNKVVSAKQFRKVVLKKIVANF